MGNVLLFLRLNATAATPHWQVVVATFVAQWVIALVPLGLVLAWVGADERTRLSLVEAAVAVALALGIGQVITHLWPQPRPFMVPLGLQLLPHEADPGLPSDHVTVFWSLACAAWVSLRASRVAAILFALGLLVGWSRVLLGVHFPLDVAAALPVGVAGALLARAGRPVLRPVTLRLLRLWSVLRREAYEP